MTYQYEIPDPSKPFAVNEADYPTWALIERLDVIAYHLETIATSTSTLADFVEGDVIGRDGDNAWIRVVDLGRWD